jgi:hypothetical protein
VALGDNTVVVNNRVASCVEIPSPEEERAKGKQAMTVAWFFLWAAFGLFVILAISIPWATLAYFNLHASPRQASLSVLSGTVLVRERGARVELNAASGKQIEEGDQVRTTSNSHAVLWLPEGSNLRLWPNSDVAVHRIRNTTYSDRLWELQLQVNRGHARLEVSLPLTQERKFNILTPHGSAQLGEGSYTIEVAATESDIIVRNGAALVGDEGQVIKIAHLERATLRAGEPPEGPLPAVRNLIVNGNFDDGFDNWVVFEEAEETNLGTTVITRDVARNRNVVLFSRPVGTRHGENRLFQAINRDVSDLQSLILKLDYFISEQTLSGGGWQGSEYPLQVRVKYRDVYDSETGVTRGFFYQNADNHPTPNGVEAPRNAWQTFSLDLFDPSLVQPRPNYLLSVELVASGWAYESRLAQVRLESE